ncbi:hypothetical protein HZA75_01675 [Candidatus Roizmanbacteria bacterium]|nr:hypothetical protein [Candidatus Roizmanbacteria bacterium]
MQQELKIKINNIPPLEENLNSLGAAFVEEQTFADTYFNQPAGEVLKLGDNDKGFFFQSLKATPDGKFTIIKNNQIENFDQVKAEMAREYGIKCVLKGKRRIYTVGADKIILNSIDGLGDFLILTGENPTEDFFVKKLGIQNPEYIKVSFDTLQLTATNPTA